MRSKPRVEGAWGLYYGMVYRWWVWPPRGHLHGKYRTWSEAIGVALWLAVRR